MCFSYGECYALPGGDNGGELLTEAVCRELLEETGFAVEPVRLSAVYECITGGRSGNNHKLYFIFLCRLTGAKTRVPTELDAYQIDQKWVPLDQIAKVNLFPRIVRNNIVRMLATEETIYLGSERRK